MGLMLNSYARDPRFDSQRECENFRPGFSEGLGCASGGRSIWLSGRRVLVIFGVRYQVEPPPLKGGLALCPHCLQCGVRERGGIGATESWGCQPLRSY